MRPSLLLALALLLSPAATAQYVLYGGVADAVDAFGDTNGAGAGRAGYGLAVGFDYEVPSRYERGITAVVGLALMTSAFGADDLRTDLFGGTREGRLSAQPYVHLPASFGFRYRMFEAARVSPTLGGRVLYTITRFPRLEVTTPSGTELELEAAGAGGFGFGADAGLSIGDRFDVGVRYLGIGERQFDVEIDAESVEGDEATVGRLGSQSVSIGVLYAGYRF